MSDLNDLIHTNAHRAYEQGVQREQERIIKLIERLDIDFMASEDDPFAVGDALDLIALIKGEQK